MSFLAWLPRSRSSCVLTLGVTLAVATLVSAASAQAQQLRFKTLADGTKMIYNETSTQKARRTAGALLRIPQADLGRMIDRHARSAGLDPRLVQAVIQAESGYNVKARSIKGAMGLMQLMPGTARDLRVDDPYDPDDNIRGGTTYLRRMYDHFGDLTLAVAAYNAGPSNVTRYGGIPPFRETRNYVHKVFSLFRGTPASAVWAKDATTKPKPKPPAVPQGAHVFVTRDADNRIVFTTKAPQRD